MGSVAPVDISVLIATYNGAERLARTLRAIEASPSTTWEVVVVDDGSSDDTPRVLAELARELPVRSLAQTNSGKSAALNRAMEIAKGGLFVFTDDDIEPSASWLDAYRAGAMRWPDSGVFAGPIDPIYPEVTPGWMRRDAYAGWGFGRFRPPANGEEVLVPPWLPFGANFAVRASLMKGVQFDERIGPRREGYATGEDTELLERLRSRGVEMRYLPAASVQHRIHRQSLSPGWWRRRALSFGREAGYRWPVIDWTPFTGALIQPSKTVAQLVTSVWGSTFRRLTAFEFPMLAAWTAGFIYERWRDRNRGARHDPGGS